MQKKYIYLIAALMGIASVPISAACYLYAWNQLLVPLGAPRIPSLSHMAGILILVGVMRYRSAPPQVRAAQNEWLRDHPTDMLQPAFDALLMPLFMALIVWLVT